MDFFHLRFYVKTRWLLDESIKTISNDLKLAYSGQATSLLKNGLHFFRVVVRVSKMTLDQGAQ